jgi:hypothetical protein
MYDVPLCCRPNSAGKRWPPASLGERRAQLSSQSHHIFMGQEPGKTASDQIAFLVAFRRVSYFGPQFWRQSSAWLGRFQDKPRSRLQGVACQKAYACNRNVLNYCNDCDFFQAKSNRLDGIGGIANYRAAFLRVDWIHVVVLGVRANVNFTRRLSPTFFGENPSTTPINTNHPKKPPGKNDGWL